MNPLSLFPLLLLVPCAALAEGPSLTIYNQNFAVVRDTVPLDLKEGTNQVRFTETTAHMEPDSVILRDPKGVVKLQILEQNYLADPVSEGLMLSLNEGKTINFVVKETNKPDVVVQGKIIRSGYSPHATREAMEQPVIEVNGELQFTLPGQPRFPKLADDTILKPTLDWQLRADKPGKLDAELCYVTGGMSWEANYNLVAPEKGDLLDIVGWITMNNDTGKSFKDANIKLVAGDVTKFQRRSSERPMFANDAGQADPFAPPVVKEKTFDEYHLYTIQRPATLHDRETKQVEFTRASGVKSERIYIYEGFHFDPTDSRNYPMTSIQMNGEFGTKSNPKVWVMREFKNNEANHLGIALPKGRVRFYRQDEDGQLQFTGENFIDHTAKDELVQLYTGNAFDLVGERKQTKFNLNEEKSMMDESFEIKLRNHKKEAVEIRVLEHLLRWTNWEIREKSDPFQKKDAQKIEFLIHLKPDEERTVIYTVHYSWGMEDKTSAAGDDPFAPKTKPKQPVK